MAEGTILLVEDNPDDVALILRALKKMACVKAITVLHNGQQALDYLFARGSFAERDPRELPSLVILDLKMPKVGGLGVLRQLRENETTQVLPTVVFTSSREERDLAAAYHLGTNSYICKPTDYTELEAIMQSLGQYWCEINEPLR